MFGSKQDQSSQHLECMCRSTRAQVHAHTQAYARGATGPRGHGTCFSSNVICILLRRRVENNMKKIPKAQGAFLRISQMKRIAANNGCSAKSIKAA